MANVLAGASRPDGHSNRLREVAREVTVLRDKVDTVGVLCQPKLFQTSNRFLVSLFGGGQPILGAADRGYPLPQ